MLTTSIVNVCDEREWCTDYGTLNWVLVYFNSVIKCVKQCCCTLILLPKSTLNANLTTTNRFFTNDDWQHGRFKNFESDHQYESNLESDVRFEIESNHEALQVHNTHLWFWHPDSVHLRFFDRFFQLLVPSVTICQRNSNCTASRAHSHCSF